MKITEKVKMVTLGLAAVATLGATALIAPAVSAAQDSYTNASKYTSGTEAGTGAGQNTQLMGSSGILNTIINVALGVIGFVAVVMIIFGGVQYTTSAGDAAKVTKAKNTIMYGVVGLVIALLAFAIVNFILGNVFNV
ncbi:hypothetical protein IKD60_03270 [Candidatus Saccharibacteria bacterium]|nr:hypothetical protein [Candidatus Saccharibacteria bacterium]